MDLKGLGNYKLNMHQKELGKIINMDQKELDKMNMGQKQLGNSN